MPTQTSPRKPRPLSQKRQRLIKELPTASSITEAGRKAGFSPRTAYLSAHRAIQNDTVAAAIEQQNALATSENVMSLIRRKERLSELAIPDPEHPDPVRAIAELNRMERIGEPRGSAGDTNIDNRTQILMAYTPEQLRALLSAMEKASPT